ncbi:MAG: hypothetical protein Q9173_001109 [Seirophora scorigena]
MLGQGMNAWQAEMDAAAELADFYSFNAGFAQEIYDKQPAINSPGHHSRTDWRPLEAFVYAVSPFNFTAIGGKAHLRSGADGQRCRLEAFADSQALAFFDAVKHELSAVKVGPPEEFENFLGPVINRAAFDKITKAIDSANQDDQLERVVSDTYDGSKGFFIDPTIYVAETPDHVLFNRELFGRVLVAYVYPDAKFDNVLDMIDRQGGNLALTGAIFSSDQVAIRKAED